MNSFVDFKLAPPLTFIFPIDGDVLFEELDGEKQGDVLAVCASLQAAPGLAVEVNGIPAIEQEPGIYRVELSLGGYRTALCARCVQTGEQCAISVF